MNRVELVRAAYDRFRDEDIEGALDFLDPRVQMSDMIHGTTLRGKDAVEAFWRKEFDLVQHYVTPHEISEMGDAVKVVSYHQLSERDGAPLGNGVSSVQRITFRGDRIAKIEVTSVDPIPEAVRKRLR